MPTQDFDFDAAADDAVKRGTSALTEAVKAGARDGVIAAFRHLGLAAMVKGDKPDDEGGEVEDDPEVPPKEDEIDGEGEGEGEGDEPDPENDPANAVGADDNMLKGDDVDVTALFVALAGVPATLQRLGSRLDALEKAMPTRGEITAVRLQVAELAKGTAAGMQQLLVVHGDTATRLVEQPGRTHQFRANPNTSAQRAGENADPSRLTDLELAKALAQEVITTQLKRTYNQNGRFCEDEQQNADLTQQVRAAVVAYDKQA